MSGRKLGSLCGSASTSIRVDRTAKEPEPIFVVRSPATCRDIDGSMCLCRITVRDMESSVAETCRTAQRVGPCRVRVQEPLAHRDRRSNSMHHPCLPTKVTRGRVSTYMYSVLRTAWCMPIALIRSSGTLRSRISQFSHFNCRRFTLPCGSVNAGPPEYATGSESYAKRRLSYPN